MVELLYSILGRGRINRTFESVERAQYRIAVDFADVDARVGDADVFDHQHPHVAA